MVLLVREKEFRDSELECALIQEGGLLKVEGKEAGIELQFKS